MSVRQKFEAGGVFPLYAWPSLRGWKVTPAAGSDWRVLVIYRGAHCPLCVKYLHDLGRSASQFEALGVRIWALSADPLERASEQAGRENWQIEILAELQEEQMRELGLYISSPRTPAETDRNFAEPAVFVINPISKVQIIDVSNAPFARPEPAGLLAGLNFLIQQNYPVRGMVS